MGQAAHARPTFSVRDYYTLEEDAKERHEYFRGEIYAMAGGTPSHAQLIGQAVTEINIHLRGSGCYAAPGDQRIRSEEGDLIAYPDVVVVCRNNAEFDPDNPNTLLTPIYLVEILSPSTASYDRSTKLGAYRLIPSLAGVLIISQNAVRVEHHFRDGSENWVLRTHSRLSDFIHLLRLDIDVSLAELYRDLDLPEGTLELVP